MQAYFLWSAVVMSVITFSVHTFIGSPVATRPLLANTDLPKASKWLNYYCWHVTTLFTLLMGAGYTYAALQPGNTALVVYISVNTLAFSVLSVAVTMKGGINPFRFPSTTLFAMVSFLGFASCLAQ